ncbi:MAG: hypothetical protein ACRDK9_08905 [Solirubrobacterales bacterium]
MLPRGMDEDALLGLLGGAVELEDLTLVADAQPDLPAPVRRDRPALYRVRRRADSPAPAAA